MKNPLTKLVNRLTTMFKASDKIDEKRKLTKQLESKKAGITNLSRAESLARGRSRESKELLSSYIRTMEYKKQAEGEGYQNQLKQHEEQHREAERKHQEAIEALAQCEEDIMAIESALKDFQMAITPEDLADYQEKPPPPNWPATESKL